MKNQIIATYSRRPFEIEYSYADTGRVFLRDRNAGNPAINAEKQAVRDSFKANFDTSENTLVSIKSA